MQEMALFATSPVASVLCTALQLYSLCIIGVIICSWFPLAPGGPGYAVYRVLRQITDPVLMPLRKLIPPIAGVFDVTPIIVIFLVQFIHGRLC